MNLGEIAAAAGVSVRTLHHWDAVGLLRPSGRAPSGYGVYGPVDVERLRQVLTYLELGFALEEVRALLDDPDVDALDHLRRQQSLLAERIAHLQAVQELVHRAVEAQMGADDLRAVFGDEDPSRYETEVQERWGDTDACRQSRQRTSAFGRDDWLRVRAQGEDVERRFAAALRAGRPASSAEAGALVEDHRAWIGQFYDCSPEMQVDLAEAYLSDERFTAHYEAVAPALARYVHDAVRASACAR
ncbi:MAG: tipA [Frankiales bacterium]|nr:tipA [Frankiales bacterium]